MEQIPTHISDLIIRQLNGELNRDERQQLEEWIALSPEHQRHFADEQEIWFSATSHATLERYDHRQAFDRFLQRIADTHSQESQSRSRGRRQLLSTRFWRSIAATAAVVVAVAYLSYQGGRQQVVSQFADITIEAPIGSRSRTMLPDGSVVWLNAGSQLTYQQSFGIHNRLVKLLGEGYFEVAKGKALPFRVASGSLEVEVLGTKFNFRDYPADVEASVTLNEGSVALSTIARDGSPTLMHPNQRAVYNKQSRQMTIESCEPDNARQWTKGNLLYEGETLAEIVKDLSRSYNVDITVSDASLYRLRFHGEFIRQEQTLREVLDALSATGKIRYEMNGRNVRIY